MGESTRARALEELRVGVEEVVARDVAHKQQQLLHAQIR